ncbi:MAG: CRISPR-associated protein Cas4 [Chloroflexia bacterium]|nr:CRISPR-associated protein Cas4 [Chloroflexia bacterium]
MAERTPSVSPTWRDEDLVLISALEHWSYCPRQCALIHLEQTYDENIFTLRGNRAHERAHRESAGTEDGVRVTRGLPLWSDQLGLVGKADIVEWRGDTPYPVEYKVGKKRAWGHEVVQLCAQAICLAEILGTPVPSGAIYYAGSKRRRQVTFTPEDYRLVETSAEEIRLMLEGDRLPHAVDDARCPNCSLVDACAPGIASRPAIIRGHYAELFHPRES